MKAITKITLAIAIAAFAFSAPAIAANIPTPAAETQAKTSLGDQLKNKAGDMVEQAKDKTDNTAEKIQDALGTKKPGTEAVDVQKESVTVQTPQGTASETTTTIIPEAPQAPVIK